MTKKVFNQNKVKIFFLKEMRFAESEKTFEIEIYFL